MQTSDESSTALKDLFFLQHEALMVQLTELSHQGKALESFQGTTFLSVPSLDPEISKAIKAQWMLKGKIEEAQHSKVVRLKVPLVVQSAQLVRLYKNTSYSRRGPYSSFDLQDRLRQKIRQSTTGYKSHSKELMIRFKACTDQFPPEKYDFYLRNPSVDVRMDVFRKGQPMERLTPGRGFCIFTGEPPRVQILEPLPTIRSKEIYTPLFQDPDLEALLPFAVCKIKEVE